MKVFADIHDILADIFQIESVFQLLAALFVETRRIGDIVLKFIGALLEFADSLTRVLAKQALSD